jgi:hypothetical protein
MSSQIRPYRFLPLLSIALATLAVSASCGADSAQAYVLGPPSMPWSTSLSGTGAPFADALITSGSFSVPSTYRTPSGQVVNTGHLAIEYMQVICPTGATSNPMFVIDSGPSLRGGVGFSDRGISGFRAGHNRRNEVHEEAQT